MNKILYEDKSEFCETKSGYVNIHKSFCYVQNEKNFLNAKCDEWQNCNNYKCKYNEQN